MGFVIVYVTRNPILLYNNQFDEKMDKVGDEWIEKLQYNY